MTDNPPAALLAGVPRYRRSVEQAAGAGRGWGMTQFEPQPTDMIGEWHERLERLQRKRDRQKAGLVRIEVWVPAILRAMEGRDGTGS